MSHGEQTDPIDNNLAERTSISVRLDRLEEEMQLLLMAVAILSFSMFMLLRELLAKPPEVKT